MTPGETESVATTGRVVDAGTTARVPDTDATGNGEPGAQDLGSPSLGSQTDDSSQSQSTNDDTGAPNLEGRGEPVTDEAVVDYLARRSLGENPTQEQLNERRGWAATLLSAEGNEVRDRIKARADEAAASK